MGGRDDVVAAALATFASILGCPIRYVFHEPFGYLNTVTPVGQAQCNNPFFASANRRSLPGPLDAVVQAAAPKPYVLYGRLADPDEVFRSSFGNHAYAMMDGEVYDATMRSGAGALLVNLTHAAYEAAVIDASAPGLSRRLIAAVPVLVFTGGNPAPTTTDLH